MLPHSIKKAPLRGSFSFVLPPGRRGAGGRRRPGCAGAGGRSPPKPSGGRFACGPLSRPLHGVLQVVQRHAEGGQELQ